METTRTVGRYELVGELGAGGMASVHLACQAGLDRLVALKELRAFGPGSPDLAVRFVREARVAGQLSHPNVVIVFDFFEESGTPYIAMEYLPRGSLRPWMRELTLAQVGGVLDGVLSGLAHAEQHRVVHRDLKPENLLVTRDGQVKIADFGIAKALDEISGVTVTKTGGVLGTPGYMAPEQVLGEEIGPWTDLYSVGVIAYELMSGGRPFPNSARPILVGRSPPALGSVNPAVPSALSDWVDRLLVPEPAQRIQSARAAREQLDQVISELLGPAWRQQAPLDLDSGAVSEVGTRTSPASPPPHDLPKGPLFPGSLAIPSGPSTPPPSRRAPIRRRGALLAGALVITAALGGVAAAIIAPESHAKPRSRGVEGARSPAVDKPQSGTVEASRSLAVRESRSPAVASACRLARAEEAATTPRARTLSRMLRRAKTWQDSQHAVVFDAQQWHYATDTLRAALLELNTPTAHYATVTPAIKILKATSNDYRTYARQLNTAHSPDQLANAVASFQAPDQVPVRVALVRLGGPGCLPPPPPPINVGLLYSKTVRKTLPRPPNPTPCSYCTGLVEIDPRTTDVPEIRPFSANGYQDQPTIH